MESKINWYRKIINAISFLLIIGTTLFLIFFWSKIPASVPVHYGKNGIADAWGSKFMVFFMPIMSTLLFIGISMLEKHPEVWNTPIKVISTNKKFVYGILSMMIVTTKAIMAACFTYIAVNIALSQNLSPSFTIIVLLISSGTIIFFISWLMLGNRKYK